MQKVPEVIIEIQLPAPDGGLFARDAFDHQVGKTFKFAGQDAVLLASRVTLTGKKAKLTIDAPLRDLTRYLYGP